MPPAPEPPIPYTSLEDFIRTGLTYHLDSPEATDPDPEATGPECEICRELFADDLTEVIVETKSCSRGACLHGHIFHMKCLLGWLRVQKKNSCPKCRHVFFPDPELDGFAEMVRRFRERPPLLQRLREQVPEELQQQIRQLQRHFEDNAAPARDGRSRRSVARARVREFLASGLIPEAADVGALQNDNQAASDVTLPRSRIGEDPERLNRRRGTGAPALPDNFIETLRQFREQRPDQERAHRLDMIEQQFQELQQNFLDRERRIEAREQTRVTAPGSVAAPGGALSHQPQRHRHQK